MAKSGRRFLSGFLAAAFLTATTPAAFAQTVQQPQAPQVNVQQQPSTGSKKSVDVPAMTEWRQDFHKHPETAFTEVRTAEKIDSLLRSWGLETHTNVGKTGVVGILKGPNAGPNSPSICLRADIDALPITEDASTLPYKSENPGKMHACGHDGHTAMLLGAAKYLAETKNFTGTVYFIFQPAEEAGNGAQAMIDDGLFKWVHCDGIYGMHAWPSLPAGTIAVAEGNITSNTDGFKITITGKGGHAAYPADNIDVIQLAADIVTELHKYKDKEIPADEGAVLAVTTMHGGEAFNAMPEKVSLAGTVRTFSATSQDKLEKAVKEISAKLSTAYGAKVEVQYDRLAASVYNSHDQTVNARAAAAEVVGDINVVVFPRTMAGEDFSAFTKFAPGAFIALGQNAGGPKTQLHNPNFNFNDATLETGASYWVGLVERQLPLVKPVVEMPKTTPPGNKP
ncbi:MAG: M20 family metallopeptidase [Alphaproteobacteria bacterium]